MILERLIFWFSPILLSFSAIPFLSRSKTFAKLETLEKIVFSLASGSAGVIFILTFYGILMPKGFAAFSWFLFSLMAILTIGAGALKRKTIGNFLKSSFFEARKTIYNPVKLLFLVAPFAYFSKALLFLVYKPSIDADVVDSYLPFARSIYLADRIPLKDFFSGRIITNPPIGGSIIYAWIYALTGSISSQSFRLIPLPFLLGSVALIYLIGKKIWGTKVALLSSIIFMFLPFQDQTFFLNVYYPDHKFLFFGLSFLYLLIMVFEKVRKKGSKDFYLYLIGLSVAISFLLKPQAIFLFFFLGLMVIGEFKIFKPYFRKIVGVLLIIGFFIAPFIFLEFQPYGRPPFWSSIFLGMLVLFYLWYFEKREDSLKASLRMGDFFKLLIISSIGGIWSIRNLIIFHHPFEDFSTQNSRILAEVSNAINKEVANLSGFDSFTRVFTWPKHSWLGIFCWPLFGTFWLVPKLWGLISILRHKKGLFLLFWGFGWFCFWQVHLGGVNGDRYPLPLIPVLVWVVAVGVEEISRGFKVVFFKKKSFAVNTIAVLIVIFGLLFSLIQSQFLWWNAGVLFYGQPKNLRSEALEVIAPQVRKTLNIFEGELRPFLISRKSSLFIIAKKLVVIITANCDLSLEYMKELMSLGFLVFPVVFLFLFLLPKDKLSKKTLSILIVLLGVVLFLPYFFVFWFISQGDLSQFARLEREKVYSLWGQAKFIEPFLLQNARKEDKIIFYGNPSWSISYYTGLPVYNIEYTVAGTEIIFPLIGEENKEKIYSFLKERGIRFFIIDTHGRSAARFAEFKKLVKFLAILDDQQYVEQKVFPSEENAWALYEVKW